MFGYPDGMWAKQLRQLGNKPGMTEEEKRGQGQALPELMEMLHGPPEFSTQEKGQPLVQHSELTSCVVGSSSVVWKLFER